MLAHQEAVVVNMGKSVFDLFIDKVLIHKISSERINELEALIEFGIEHSDKEFALLFVCTHNSRRSFFCEVWGQVAAEHYSMSNITTYSAGTEATAIYSETINALINSGLKIEKITENENPVFALRYNETKRPIIGFSKTIDNHSLPVNNVAAIMTCDNANDNCPFIPYAKSRIPLTYEDPKKYDGLPNTEEGYLNKSLEIASEMFYIMNQIKNRK